MNDTGKDHYYNDIELHQNIHDPCDVSIHLGGKRVYLNISDIESIIQRLARIRSTMVPYVSETAGDLSVGSVNPIIVCEASDIPGYTALCVRSPGLGWIKNLLDEDVARKLALALIGSDRLHHV